MCRGFAALAVAAGHYIIDGAYTVDGQLPQAHTLSVLWNFSFIYAVDFFLVLSGFILAHSYFYRLDIGFKDFVLRRFFRMYPLHLLMMCVAIGVLLLFGLNLRTSDIVLHTLFIHNMGLGPESPALNVPAWTISIEFWVNVGVLAALLALRRHRQFALAGLLALAVLCFALIAWQSGHLAVTGNFAFILNAGLMRCFAAFVLGLIAYELYQKYKGWEAPPVLLGLSLLSFVAIVLFLPGKSPWGFATPWIFAGVVFVLACSEPKLKALGQRLAWFGDVSFSVYLVHHPFVAVFRETGVEKSPVSTVAFVLLVYGVAAITYRYFERPTYRWLLQETKSVRIPRVRLVH